MQQLPNNNYRRIYISECSNSSIFFSFILGNTPHLQSMAKSYALKKVMVNGIWTSWQLQPQIRPPNIHGYLFLNTPLLHLRFNYPVPFSRKHRKVFFSFSFFFFSDMTSPFFNFHSAVVIVLGSPGH